MNRGARYEALLRGDKFYRGQPCKYNHDSLRRTSTSTCLECYELTRAKYRDTDRYREVSRKQARKQRMRHPATLLYWKAKERARHKDVPFDLTIEYVRSIWPEDGMCPALGVPLVPNTDGRRPHRLSPTLDRVDLSRGYVQGNVAIISMQANQIKQDVTSPDALRRVADWMEQFLCTG